MKILRAVLIVLAIVALFFFVRELLPDPSNRNLGRVRELQDSVTVRDARITDLTTAVQTISAMWVDSAGVWQARRDSAAQEAETARRNARTTAARLRATLTAAQQAELDSVTTSYETALTNKDRIISSLETDVRLLVAFKDTAEALIPAQADQIRDLTEAHNLLVDELTKGFSLLGIRIKGVCGPGVTAGMGLKGPDIVGGIGCSVWADRKPQVARLPLRYLGND